MELAVSSFAILIQKASCRSSVRRVSGASTAVFTEHFPDPAEQAEALLEICQGDLGEAQGIAAINLKFANYEADRFYWSRVTDLISRQEPSVVAERLAMNKLKRSKACKSESNDSLSEEHRAWRK